MFAWVCLEIAILHIRSFRCQFCHTGLWKTLKIWITVNHRLLLFFYNYCHIVSRTHFLLWSTGISCDWTDTYIVHVISDLLYEMKVNSIYKKCQTWHTKLTCHFRLIYSHLCIRVEKAAIELFYCNENCSFSCQIRLNYNTNVRKQ